jgi:hypothetical protein
VADNTLRYVLLSFGLLALGANYVQAQRPVVVGIGTKVRVRLAEDTAWRVGRLISTASDTLRLQECDTCSTTAYLIPTLAAIEVKSGRSVPIALGALFGALLGAGVGGLYAWEKTRDCDNEGLCGLAYFAIPVFGAGGLVVGGVVGAFIPYAAWQPAVIR